MTTFSIRLLAAVATALLAAPGYSQGTQGWVTHNDARGMAVNAPAGWRFTSDQQAGRMILQGPQGEQVVVWPASLQQAVDPKSAATLVQQLARQTDAQLPWSAATGAAGVVRTVAKGPQRSGTAMLRWSSGASGTSLLFFCVEAPANAYQAEAATFAGILGSVRLLQDAPAQGGAAGGPTAMTTWKDPRENAFSISIPQGWKALGGSYRLSTTDVRIGVTLASTDGQIRVMMGDSNVGVYIAPNQMMLRGGMRAGSNYSLSDGTKMLVEPYMTGQQGARMYAQQFLARECTGMQIVSNNARVEVVGPLLQRARSEGMQNPQLTAGDVTVNCTVSGTVVRGTFVAATVLPVPAQSGIWEFYRLYGYLATPGREQEAQRIAEQVAASLRIDPQWQAQETQMANQAVAAAIAQSQQIWQQARQAIEANQRETSNMIMSGWEHRNQVNDEVARRRENAILGQVDVVDPSSGARYKVDNLSDFHFMNNSGVIGGNNTGSAPGPDWRSLVTLP